MVVLYGLYAIVSAVLYGCVHILLSHIKGRTQTDSNENRVLSKIFGSKREEEVTEDRRKLYNEEFHEFFLLTKYYLVDTQRRQDIHSGF